MITFSYSYRAGFRHGKNLGKASNCIGDPIRQHQFSKHCVPHVCDTNAMHLSICNMVRKHEGDKEDYIEGTVFFLSSVLTSWLFT